MSEQDDLTTWLRQRIRERRHLAEHAIELGNNAVWEETSSGVLVTSEPTEADHWHGTWTTGDSSLARLMKANDPRDTIARCEAELAIMDEHQACWVWTGAPKYAASKPCGECGGGVPCRTVRHLGYGYRHWPGWQETWKP